MLIRENYLRYCNVNFPITVCGQVIKSPLVEKLVLENAWFKVKKLVLAPDDYLPLYIVRTSNGVPMFGRRLYNNRSESGVYVVDLDSQVNYKFFDQARQNLIGPVGEAFENFISNRDGESCSADITKDAIIHFLGQDVVSLLKSNSIITIDKDDDDAIMQEQESDEKIVATELQGTLSCFYMFRNGASMANIAQMWQDCYSMEHIYLMLVWTNCIFHIMASAGMSEAFQTGFIFDYKTRALKHGTCYYVNPALMLMEIGPCTAANRIAIVSYLVAQAIHEVTHIWTLKHDEHFAMSMTHVVHQSILQEMSQSQLFCVDRQVRALTKRLMKSGTGMNTSMKSGTGMQSGTGMKTRMQSGIPKRVVEISEKPTRQKKTKMV